MTLSSNRTVRLSLIVALLIGAFALPLPVARAASFTVNSTTDAVDASPGNGICATGTSVCTLRAAIQEANALTGVHDITLAPGTYTLTLATPGGVEEDASATGDLDITANITINGNGATVSSAGLNDRVLHVLGGGSLTLNTLTVTGGSVARNGGGILNAGTLSLNGVTVAGNQTTGFNFGGGIAHVGMQLTVNVSTIRNNSATGGGGGGGLFVANGTATVDGSTLSGNSTDQQGGGLFVNGGSVTLTNSTVSGNSAADGGGIANVGVLSLRSATIYNNTASAGVGGVLNSGSTILTRNSILAGNTGTTPKDCGGPNAFFSQGFNLRSATSDCSLASPQASDRVNPTLLIGSLQNNGGATNTHALLTGSPAINAGGLQGSDCPPTDQRGVPRNDGSCDIGAYEDPLPPTPTATATSTNTPVGPGPTATFTNTPVGPGPTATPTSTPVGPGPTATPTPVSPQPTNTPGPAPTNPPPQPTSPPQPQPTALPGGGSTYIVQRGDTLFWIAVRYKTTVDALVRANNIGTPDRIEVGQTLIIPVDSATTYVARAGDTLQSIATRFGTTVAALQAANGLGTRTAIYVGQTIIIPAGATAPPAPQPTPVTGSTGAYIVQRGDTLYRIALRFNTTVLALQQANGLTGTRIYAGQRLTIPGATPVPPPAPGGSRTHLVQRGDTLFRIALRYGVTVGAIQAANRLSGTLIYAGQMLVIP